MWVFNYNLINYLDGTAFKLTDFDRQFFRIDQETLVKILITADYFELTSLIDKWAKFNADKIASMNVSEICAYFNITTDLTDEEMEVGIFLNY